MNFSSCLDVYSLETLISTHFSILSCISRSRLVSANYCLDPSGKDCKFKIYVFLAPIASIKLKKAKIGQLLAILALILALVGLKVHSLDSFLGETRREFSSRPVSSRKLYYWVVSSCLGDEIAVSKWVSIEVF